MKHETISAKKVSADLMKSSSAFQDKELDQTAQRYGNSVNKSTTGDKWINGGLNVD